MLSRLIYHTSQCSIKLAPRLGRALTDFKQDPHSKKHPDLSFLNQVMPCNCMQEHHIGFISLKKPHSLVVKNQTVQNGGEGCCN